MFQVNGAFFTANDIDDVNKKSAILLTVIRPKAYKLFQSLVASERLDVKSYTNLMEAMKKHNNPNCLGLCNDINFQPVQVAG